jgi:hypothetical protein
MTEEHIINIINSIDKLLLNSSHEDIIKVLSILNIKYEVKKWIIQKI